MFYNRWAVIFSVLLTPLLLFGILSKTHAQAPGIDEPIEVGPWNITLVDAYLLDEIVSGNGEVYSPDKESYAILITRLHVENQALEEPPLITMQTFDMKLLDAEGDVIADSVGFRLEQYFCMKAEACHSIGLSDEETVDREYVEYAFVVSPDEAKAELALEVALGHAIEPSIELDIASFEPSPSVFGSVAPIRAANWQIHVSGISRKDEIKGVFDRTYSANEAYDFLLVAVEFENLDPSRATALRHRDFKAVIRNSEGVGKQAIGAGSTGTDKYCLWAKGCLGSTNKEDTTSLGLEYVFVVEEAWLQDPVELEAVLMIPAEQVISFTLPFGAAETEPEAESAPETQITPTPTDTPTPVPTAVPTSTPTPIPTSTPSPTPVPTEPPAVGCTGTVTASGAVNMREGPGTEYAILRSVSLAGR